VSGETREAVKLEKGQKKWRAGKRWEKLVKDDV